MADRSQLFHDLVSGRRRGPAGAAGRAALWWARLPYGAGVAVRNRLFDAGLRTVVRLPVPVVCVGNLSLGGTGKTPMVEWVARQLVDMGRRPAIVSRGYGAGDEGRVLEDNLPDVPHLSGADRAAVARTAVEELEADCVVLDDGFQHRRLARDLDIVLVDATRPPHHDYLFPRGTLREPVGGLKRAGVIVLTRYDQGDSDGRLVARLSRRFDAPVVLAAHSPNGFVGVDGTPIHVTVAGRSAGLVSGIGNPLAFRRTADELGADIRAERVYADHHPYTAADVADLRRWAETLPADAIVLTTQKDMVKLRLDELAGRPVYAVRVGIHFLGGGDVVRDKLREAVGEAAGVPA